MTSVEHFDTILAMNKLKVGVIGVGYLGALHARTYYGLGQAQLSAVCDINPVRLNEISQELGVCGVSDYKQLMGKVDAVSIAVPTNLHYRVAADFLSRNIPVLVEKPLTVNLTQADKLIALARRNKTILQVGHIERFNAAYVACNKIIKNPRFIECHRLSPFPRRSLDVGVVLDLMIHDIDIILGLVKSRIKEIRASGANVLTPFEDIANARIEFANGCVCNLTSSRISEEAVRKIRIFFKNTYISLDYKNERAFVYKRRKKEISKAPLPIEKEASLKKELAHFLECITQNKKPLVCGESARAALAVALKIKDKIRRVYG